MRALGTRAPRHVPGRHGQAAAAIGRRAGGALGTPATVPLLRRTSAPPQLEQFKSIEPRSGLLHGPHVWSCNNSIAGLPRSSTARQEVHSTPGNQWKLPFRLR